MIKSFIKKSLLWKAFAHSNLYKRLHFPDDFRKGQVELNFYKGFLRSYPSKNNLIFDVGANRGQKSVVFSKLAKRVVAFEPSEKLFNHLQGRFSNSNVTVFNYALGSAVSDSEIYLVENNEAYNSLNRKHIETTAASRGIASLDTVKRQKIKVEVLENFILKFGVPKYIKIDVEGYELEVLKGVQTVVPLLSFEANLPEFYSETIKAMEYLTKISADRYVYNFANDNFFLEDNFMFKGEAVEYIKNTKFHYLEIYARLTRE